MRSVGIRRSRADASVGCELVESPHGLAIRALRRASRSTPCRRTIPRVRAVPSIIRQTLLVNHCENSTKTSAVTSSNSLRTLCAYNSVAPVLGSRPRNSPSIEVDHEKPRDASVGSSRRQWRRSASSARRRPRSSAWAATGARSTRTTASAAAAATRAAGGRSGPGSIGNQIVTGNVTAGQQFRGFVPYSDPFAFRGDTRRQQLDRFIRQSAGVPIARRARRRTTTPAC